MRKIPLISLESQFTETKEKILENIRGIIQGQRFILGRYCEELEKNISEYIGVPYAVSCASGTDALILSLMALGIKQGDEVITTPYTFFSTASSIVLTGARPVFVDIREEDMNIDERLIEHNITEKTRAIIVVHLFGKIADMESICAIGKKYGIPVIEDMAQAIGAGSKEKKAGSFGDLSALSFYPTKNLGGIGEGGMVLTIREDLFLKLKMLRVHGMDDKPYRHMLLGINSRLDEIKASALLVKLPYLQRWNEERRKIARFYNEHLKDLPVVLPSVEGEDHVFHLYVIRSKWRDRLKEFLEEKGISTGIYYPTPLHLQPCFSFLNYSEGDFPHAERASRESLAIPCYPGLKEEDLLYIVSSIKEFFEYGA